jgi:hypothetical protein
LVSGGRRPRADRHDESLSNPAPPVFWVNIDFLEMGDGRLEDLDVGEPYGDIIRECDPEMAMTLGVFKDLQAGRLDENRLRRVAGKQCGSGEFDPWE